MITVQTREEFLRVAETYLRYKEPYRPIAFEIGVYRGDFSQMIIDLVKPVSLMLVDPFQKSIFAYDEAVGYLPTAYSTDEDFEYVSKRFEDRIKLNRVYIWRDYSYNVVGKIANNLDLVYHDASHLYEDLKRDLSDWLPLMEKPGIVAGHDYGNYLFPGVKQAVDEFCAEYNFEMIIFNENGGDYALRAKSYS